MDGDDVAPEKARSVRRDRICPIEVERPVAGLATQQGSGVGVLDHVRAGKAEFRAEIEAAGLSFVEEIEISGFKESYLQVFVKK